MTKYNVNKMEMLNITIVVHYANHAKQLCNNNNIAKYISLFEGKVFVKTHPKNLFHLHCVMLNAMSLEKKCFS
jgi:hypothetical protein